MPTKKTRILTGALAALAMISLPACKSHANRVETEEEAPRMKSVVRMNDAKAQSQLLNGFFGIEANAWRWTSPKFSVVLRVPPGAATKGARLVFKLNVPEPVIQTLSNTTLSAKVGDAPLQPETYNKTGDYTYARDVPSSALQGDSVVVDFSLNKSVPPGPVDKREFGIVAQQVGLESK